MNDMADARPTALSLFSGVGGLDLGLELAFDARTVGYVEWQASAAAILLARMEEQSLEPAPVWCGDITDFDGRPWTGVVDIVCGGFPCQDLSVAGKRAGIDGERSGLWAQMARICGQVRPRLVCIENVSGLLGDEPMRRVLGDLAALGFDAQWGSLRASAVGAPHRRERVFIVAHDARHGRHEGRAEPAREFGRPDAAECGGAVADALSDSGQAERITVGTGAQHAESWGGGSNVAHDHGQGRGEHLGTQGLRRPGLDAGARRDPDRCDTGMADAGSDRWRQGAEVQRPGQPEPEPDVAIFPPGPADGEHWRDVLDGHPWLAPALDPKAAEPVLRRMADGMAAVVGSGRADALRAVGNGVVALQGGVCLSVLADRLAGDSD